VASPLDSTYANGVARLLFNNKTQKDQLTQQGDQDKQDIDTALQRMARQRSIDLLNQNHQANREGLFYSGQLTKRRGEVEHDYSDRQGDAQRDYDRRVAARAQALAQLGDITANAGSPLGYVGTGAAGLDLADLYQGAVDRQTERDHQSLLDQQAAAAAAPPPPDSAPAPAAAAPSSHASGQTKVAASSAHGGAKWVYRLGESGKWIPVRPANAFGH
jgi:hypothetical protein